MGYKLTARCNNSRSPTLHVELYDTAPDIENRPLNENLADGVELYETSKYWGWNVFSLESDWIVSTMTANGVPLQNSQDGERPFLLQTGLVQFRVTLSYIDGSTKTLYSKYCAVQTVEAENLKEMIQQIVGVGEPVKDLMKWPSSQPGEEASKEEDTQKFSMLSGTLQQGEGTGNTRMLIQSVMETYKKHSGHFAVHPEHTIRKRLVPTPFHRVKALTRESLLWSAQQGSFHKAPSGRIQVGGQHYMPMETLSEVAERDYHTYENGIVLGFLDTVIRKAQEKEALETQEEFDILRMLFFSGKDSLEGTEIDEVKELRLHYQRALGLEKRKVPRVNTLPKQTKRFQEILPYREIYRCIYDWFRNGTSWNFGNNAIFRGALADILYEYFCWKQLLHLFWEKGYRRCRDSKRTDYGDASNTKPPFSNVVYMEKEGTEVTLYYEPRISTWKGSAVAQACGISLIRMAMDRDREEKHFRDNFWTPDFMVRVEKDGRVEYGILDAKFRSAEMLLRSNNFGGTLSAMEECLYKYYLTVSDVERLERPVRMMWLLQGRTGERGRDTSFEPMEKQQITGRLEYFPQSFFDELSFGILPMTGFNSNLALERLWEEFERVWGL